MVRTSFVSSPNLVTSPDCVQRNIHNSIFIDTKFRCGRQCIKRIGSTSWNNNNYCKKTGNGTFGIINMNGKKNIDDCDKNSSSDRVKLKQKNRIESAADWTKWSAVLFMSCVVLYYRDASILLYALGSIFNTASAKILKNIIRQPRPDQSKKQDNGMPSSHATSLSYISIGFLLDAINRFQFHSLLLSPVFIFATVLLFSAVVASWWRVSVGYHTKAQVIVGWIVGSVNCFLWCRGLMPVMTNDVSKFLSGLRSR